MQSLDFLDVLCGMDEDQAHAFAVPACRKLPAFDHRDLMRHLGVVAIVSYLVSARLRHDLAWFLLVHHALLPEELAFLRDLDWPDSDIAMATACFRLFTFRPDPLRSVPLLCSCITFSTFFFCRAEAMLAIPSVSAVLTIAFDGEFRDACCSAPRVTGPMSALAGLAVLHAIGNICVRGSGAH
jgi:hypothetical protein